MFESKSPYEDCIENCGNTDDPGTGTHDAFLVDFSNKETTVDQARIEAVLDTFDLTGQNVLHVGVGKSRLAERFAPRVHLIDGLTVTHNEKARADSLKIRNYEVFLINKFSDEFRILRNRYDVIVDNNLAGFACCKRHFNVMLKNYIGALKIGGQILTDQEGMDWVCGDPRWRLAFNDLVRLQRTFPVQVCKMTQTVYSIQRI